MCYDNRKLLLGKIGVRQSTTLERMRMGTFTHKIETTVRHPVLTIKYLAHRVKNKANATIIPFFWSLVASLQKKGEPPPIKHHLCADERTQVDSFWNVHTVAGAKLASVKTAFQSRRYLEWRFSVYPLFREFMGLWGSHDNQVILDYGCGPGNDLAGFLIYTNAKKVIGIDISEAALSLASRRLALHRVDPGRVELVRISDSATTIPIDDDSVDYIYCEGVLHHTSNSASILREFHRVLKHGSKTCVMVYNYDSIWLHLYVAYEKMILQNKFPGMNIYEAFAKTTDTEECPISRCYQASEFMTICENTGFSAEYIGGYFSKLELNLFSKYKQSALQDKELGDEHKDFLRSLTLDEREFPKYMGKHAGIGGVYTLTK
jgi:ubiquinone/menaquinone biosynthesis C-methylase UbiE